MMRKPFFVLLAVLMLAACSKDPVYHGMTTEQKEAYSKAIAGEYKGTYVIIYDNGDEKATTVKIANSKMTITDQGMQAVLFHDFPVSLLSKVVTDSALSEALASAPNVNLLGNYRFYDLQENGDVSWGFKPTEIPLMLHYGGADHNLLLTLSSGVYLGLTKANLIAGTPFTHRCILQFQIIGIYEDDTLVQDLDAVWKNNNSFLTYFQFSDEASDM